MLTGFSAVGFVVAAHLFQGAVPATKTPVQEVAAFYRAHASGQLVGGALLMLAAFLYLAFASMIRLALRRAGGDSVASTLGLAGAVLFAVGVTIFAVVGAALGDHSGRMDPLTIQTLNVLYNDVFAPIAVGIAAFSIGNGIAIVMSRVLPPLGRMIGIVIGVAGLTPASLVGFLGLGVWILIVGILLSARNVQGLGSGHRPAATSSMTLPRMSTAPSI